MRTKRLDQATGFLSTQRGAAPERERAEARPGSDRDDSCFGRRSLLKASAGFGGSLLLGALPFRAFAQAMNLAPANRCFVFAYFEGGWDQLLAFDPRDPAVFTADRLPETRIMPGYSLLTDPTLPRVPVTPPQRMGGPAPRITFGPAIGRLQNHYDLMAVIRGMNMTTLSHEVGYRYFLTGKEPAGSSARGSSTATEIVAQMKPAVPIPSIAYAIETYNDNHPASASALRVNRSTDLLLTLAPSATPLDSQIEQALVSLRGQPVTCEAQLYDSRGLGSAYDQARGQMQTVVSARLDQAFLFQNQPAVLDAYNLRGQLPPYESPGGRAALAATALKRGISQCVTVNLVGRLDTHFGTQNDHALRLRSGFDALSDLVQDLRTSPHPGGGNFMEHTTIVAFSEFSRTPLINGSGGRDHHLTNACLVMGAGFKHNVVFGHSGDIATAPGVVDLATGLPSATGKNIFPDDVVATVLASAGLDYSITRTSPIRALLA